MRLRCHGIRMNAGVIFTLVALGVARAPLTLAAEAPSSEELKRQLDILAAEIQHLRTGEETGEVRADQSVFGLSPGASKVYRKPHGVSLGGYGQLTYENFAGKTHAGDPAIGGGKDDHRDTLDLLQAVLYVGYRFD